MTHLKFCYIFLFYLFNLKWWFSENFFILIEFHVKLSIFASILLLVCMRVDFHIYPTRIVEEHMPVEFLNQCGVNFLVGFNSLLAQVEVELFFQDVAPVDGSLCS